MTLIFSHVNSVTGLFALSDILTSRLTDSEPEAVSIPLRQEPLKHVSGGYALAGTTQKTVIFGRTMISWAGSKLIARTLIQLIHSVSCDGENEIELLGLLGESGLTKEELDQVSFIYHYNPPGPRLHRTPWNCEKLNLLGAEALYGAGTGVWNFFENLESKVDNSRPGYEHVLASLLARLSTHPLFESEGTDSLDYLYGGWFELAYHDGATFTKVPYAVRFWARQRDVLFSGGPIYFGWYRDYSLNVTRLQFFEKDGVRSHKQNNFVVPDFLGRDRGGPPKEPIRPAFIIHLVRDLDEPGAVYILVDHQIETERMIVEVSPSGFRVAETHNLRRKLLDLGSCDDEPTLTRKFA